VELPEPEAVVPPARTAFQVNCCPANESLTPLPVGLPGASCAKVYSGLPPTVTCRDPSGRVTTATVPTAAGADGVPEATVSGFQMLAQAPLHAGVPAASRFDV